MEGQFKLDGYTFREVKSNNPQRPYRVKCIETGEEKDSGISYNAAAALITEPIKFGKANLEKDSKDSEYVKKVFLELLLGRKKSECDDLVKIEIAERGRIKGTITALVSEDKFAEYKEYLTEFYKVRVLFENGLMRKSTNVIVEKR